MPASAAIIRPDGPARRLPGATSARLPQADDYGAGWSVLRSFAHRATARKTGDLPASSRSRATEQPPQVHRVVSAPQPFMTRDLPAVSRHERSEHWTAGSLPLVGNPRGIAGAPPESLFADSAADSVQSVPNSTRPTRCPTPAVDTPQPEPSRKPVPMDHSIRSRAGPDAPIGQGLSLEPTEFAAHVHWVFTHGSAPRTLSEPRRDPTG